ncbi:MAG TPA: pilus assembly protein PilM [Paraburkholderia sp.]|nr:pilus assembly protein PilM [Paraburkholderia sp.]
MRLRSALLPAVRRFAAGIDVGQREVRLVVLSRGLRGSGLVRLEFIASAPLFPGAMAGPEIVNRSAAGDALRDVFSQVPAACSMHTLRCAMAMPASATLTTSVPLSRLGSSPRAAGDRHTLAALEPAVMAEAERVAGIERHALAVDWFIDESPQRTGCVTIAATARAHLEARVECAAAAGITLTAVDGEPHAALRALRHAAALELDPHEPYAAVWIGDDGVHGWRIADESVAAEIRYPAPEHSGLADALRELGDASVGSVIVCGQIGLLDDVGFSMADIGDAMGCTVLLFDCSLLGDCAHAVPDELLQQPSLAVAYGLALRGLME